MTNSTLVIQPLAFAGAAGASEPLGRGLLAAIDIGSNSIHMIVVEPEPHGAYRVLGRERDMVRLGKTVFGQGKLSEAAIQAGVEALVKMTTLAYLKGVGRVVAVATSAVREAENGAEFLARIKTATGLDTQLLTGVEEGRLIFRGVREVVDLGPATAAIVDVGGGSTQWVTSEAGALLRIVSLPLGSLRQAGELAGDPPGKAEIARLKRSLALRIAADIPADGVERLVATSGTAVAAANLIDFFAGRSQVSAKGLREVQLSDLVQLAERLAALNRRALAALSPVGKSRSETLLTGVLLLLELVRRAGVDRFQVSDRALREGLVLEALGQPIPPVAEPEDLRRREVLQLAQRADSSVSAHVLQTARLALRLFDVTVSVHGLGKREREWLEYAALLHDIGYSIHPEDHHKHSHTMILHAGLGAFDRREIEIIASVVHFYRGADPTPRHPTLKTLKPRQQRTVQKLAALLRLADALDRTRASRVEEIYCAIRRGKVTLEVLSRYDVQLELEYAREAGYLFEKTFGCRLRLRQGLEIAPPTQARRKHESFGYSPNPRS